VDRPISGGESPIRELNPFPRISQIEQKIGAGLIEEVIQVAEAELKLTDELYKAKV
jgi:hypothetical protein